MKVLEPGVALYDVEFSSLTGTRGVALFTERDIAERFIADKVDTILYTIRKRTLDEVPAPIPTTP